MAFDPNNDPDLTKAGYCLRCGNPVYWNHRTRALLPSCACYRPDPVPWWIYAIGAAVVAMALIMVIVALSV